MKSIRIKELEGGLAYQLAGNQILTLNVRKVNVNIDCRQGAIWITWPDGNERVLKKGQSVSMRSNGLICVQAFAASSIVAHVANKGNTLIGNWLKNTILTRSPSLDRSHAAQAQLR